jgi:hypothetical protein
MATKTRTRPKANRPGRRSGGGRSGRSGGGRSQPGGPAALVSRVTGMLGGTGRRGASTGGGIASRAAGFVRGFMGGGGGTSRRGRRRH